MKLDSIYVYAVEAFRFYARCGKVSAEEYRREVYNTAFGSVETAELKEAHAKNAVAQALGAIYDIDAAERTLEVLAISGKAHIIKAVEYVYFTLPDKPLSMRSTASRIRRFAIICPASERTVYRWLKEARDIFAQERGLNITHKISAKKSG